MFELRSRFIAIFISKYYYKYISSIFNNTFSSNSRDNDSSDINLNAGIAVWVTNYIVQYADRLSARERINNK